jgi:hypothetical protein
MFHTLKKDKAGKPVPPYTEQTFELGDFNSQVKAAVVGPNKNYPANLRIGVQNEAVGADGKPRSMPKIWLCRLKPCGKKISVKKPGTIHDLERNCAIYASVRLVRGIYFGNTGWGMRYTLHEAYIFTNMAKNSQSSIDTGDVAEVPDSEDEREAAAKEKEVKLEVTVQDHDYGALDTFDDGTGGNGVAK